jgi:hypothetical protein
MVLFWSMALLLCSIVCGCGPKVVEAKPDKAFAEALDRIAVSVHESNRVVECAVEDQSTQLDRIESAITELSKPVCDNPACKCVDCTCVDCDCGKVVEPPAEPELPAGLKAGQEILARYTGVPWLFNGGRTSKAVLISHIVDHGLPRDGLDQFTFDELQRIHGALHADEATRLMYSTKPRTVSRPINRVQQRAIRRAPVRVQNCPGGYCPRR